MSIGLALVVSTDLSTIQELTSGLQQLSLSPNVCRDPAEGISLLNRKKFDAVIVDLQLGEPSAKVLEEVRLSASNRMAVTFAIAGNGLSATPSRAKSGFFFPRPLSPDSVRHTLRSAYGLILRERRRYFRCPVELPASILRDGMSKVRCQTVNISEGGMAAKTSVPLQPELPVKIEFTIPGCKTACRVESSVLWSKNDQVGLRFLSMPEEDKAELQNWLAEKLEETLPSSVSSQFALVE